MYRGTGPTKREPLPIAITPLKTVTIKTPLGRKHKIAEVLFQTHTLQEVLRMIADRERRYMELLFREWINCPPKNIYEIFVGCAKARPEVLDPETGEKL